MAFYQKYEEQFVNASVDEVWAFISAPENLSKITPPHMNFKIQSNFFPGKMFPGMIITYKVSPLKGLRMDWVTEITQVEDRKFFVDEQRLGPYKMWHHQHHIEATDKGVKMTDIVTYIPPMGFLGAIANKLFIAKQLNAIFDYRKKAVDELFGKYPED